MKPPPHIPFDRRSLDSGEVLIEEGDPAGSAFVILTGKLSARRGEQVLGHFGAGDILGEKASLEGGTRAAAVVAETPAEVCEVQVRDFLVWFREDARLRSALDRQRVLYALSASGEADSTESGGETTTVRRRLPTGERLVVEHGKSGVLLVRLAGSPNPDDSVQVVVGDSVRTLRLADRRIVSASVRGSWPRIGTCVTRMVEGAVLDAPTLREFRRRGEFPGRDDADLMVCICKGVVEGDVRRECIGGARTAKELERRLGIAGGCGQCSPRLRELVRELAPITDSLPVVPTSPEPARKGWRNLFSKK